MPNGARALSKDSAMPKDGKHGRREVFQPFGQNVVGLVEEFGAERAGMSASTGQVLGIGVVLSQ
jgi:hypothetical protein